MIVYFSLLLILAGLVVIGCFKAAEAWYEVQERDGKNW